MDRASFRLILPRYLLSRASLPTLTIGDFVLSLGAHYVPYLKSKAGPGDLCYTLLSHFYQVCLCSSHLAHRHVGLDPL